MKTPFMSTRAHWTFMGLIVGGIAFGNFFILLNLNVGLGTIIGAILGLITGYRFGVFMEEKPGYCETCKHFYWKSKTEPDCDQGLGLEKNGQNIFNRCFRWEGKDV